MQSRFVSTLIASTLVLVAGSGTAVAEITKFAILTRQPNSLPAVGLNDEVHIRVDGETAIQPNTIQLRLDGWPLLVEPRVRPDRGELIFWLVRLDTNRSMWSHLLESVRKHQAGLQSFRSMRRIEASRRNASALRLRFSQSFASLRQRLSQAKVRSTTQRRGSATNPFVRSERLTIAISSCGKIFSKAF